MHFFLAFNGLQIWYWRVFGVADHESELKIQKFKMADPIWQTKMQSYFIGWNLVFGVADYEFELKVQKFKMADPIWRNKLQKAKKKFGIRRFLGSLITNPTSEFRNSKWRIQYGGPKCKKQKIMTLDWDQIWYLEVLGVADYESQLKILKFKTEDPIWLTKMQKVTYWNLVPGIFWRCWLRIRAQNSQIQNIGYNMSYQNATSKKLCCKEPFAAYIF